jgi:hypothetical protein
MSHYADLIEAQSASPSIDVILNERGSRYGEFHNHANLSQMLKNAIMQHYYYTHGKDEAPALPPYMVEALSMICHKLARIANGDPYYDDSWQDISGYSQLVVEQLTTKQRQGV